jgi:hypothetical protein
MRRPAIRAPGWVIVGLAAVVLAAVAIPRAMRLLAGTALMLVTALMLLEWLRNLRCPNCLRRGLARRTRSARHWREALCRSCGQWWARGPLSAWEPIEGPDSRPRRDTEDPWQGGPVVDDSSPTDTTTGKLLQVKQVARQSLKRGRPSAGATDPPPG